jgi:integrase
MAKRHLTAAFVSNAKPAPGAAQTDYFDTALPAFGLRAGKQRKSWFVMARTLKGGAWRLSRITLGTTAELSLAEARQAARDAIEQAQQGQDPTHSRKKRREAMEARSRDTYGRVREQFLERYIGRKNQRPSARTLGQMKRALSADVLSGWEERPLADIDKRDVRAALDALVARGAPVMANRTLTHFRLLFRWAKERDIVEVDPTADLKKPGAEKSCERALKMDELTAVWHATDPIDIYGGIVRVLLLTGQRREEIAGMRWSEIVENYMLQPADEKKRVPAQVCTALVLPPERTKNRRGHVVPLSTPVLDIIEARRREQAAIGMKSEFVFTTTGSTSFSGFSKPKRRLNARADLAEAWTLHDLRRSMVTHMADDLHVAPHVIEAVINHVSGHKGGVAGIYNKALHLPERRAALDAWADFILRTVGEAVTDNVVALRAAKDG